MPSRTTVADLPAWRAWVAPGVAFAVLLAILVAAIVTARLTGDPALPERPAAFQTPVPAAPTLAFDVERVTGSTLILAAGKDTARERREVSISDAIPVDVLEASPGSAINVGDWVTIVGVKNEARNFAIRMVVVVADNTTPGADGWVRSPSGFLGSEAAREAREVAILGGPVKSVNDRGVVIDQGGPITLELKAGAPVRTVRKGGLTDIKDGDRIAMHLGPDGQVDLSRGLLLLSKPQ